MRSAGGMLIVASLAGGCAGAPVGERPVPPILHPSDGVLTASAPPEPEPAAPVPEAVPAVVPSECTAVERQLEAGDHKLAVDALAAVRRSGVTCPARLDAKVALSAAVVEEADRWARKGLEARRQGRSGEARVRFERALEVYPKYYWVRRLLADELVGDGGDPTPGEGAEGPATTSSDDGGDAVSEGGAPDARLVALRNELALAELAEARTAQESGDAQQALARLQRAIAARPDDPHRIAEIVEFSRLLGLQFFSAGELVEARTTWAEALTLDEANQALVDFLAEVDARLQKLDALQRER